MKSEYYWTFRIETSRFGGVLGPSCDYVTDENREAWQRFVENKIRELMKPETMDLPEFKEYLAKVQEEKRKREEYERREKELRIKHAEDEHYNYFDDSYSPEYAIDDLIDLFAGLEKAGKLPIETKDYLDKAWLEIEDTACYQDYGLPRKGLK